MNARCDNNIKYSPRQKLLLITYKQLFNFRILNSLKKKQKKIKFIKLRCCIRDFKKLPRWFGSSSHGTQYIEHF